MLNLGPVPARRSDRAAPLTRPRARVLELLQQRDSPVSAEDVARRYGQHVNTVRLHLDYLAQNGLALRERAPGTGRGRPSWHYRANPDRPEPDPRVREYGALAGALAAHIARTSPLPVDDAHAAGMEWGRQEARERDLHDASSADARRTVVSILDELGFAPAANQRQTTVHLTNCPLLDVATHYPEVICQVHRGLIAGLLESLGKDPEGADLRPFSDPGSCRLHLDAARAAQRS
ncbi:MAG: helix-turn-helix transcriptional regulator [Candidatus Nanopelagicales bacterium]